LRRFVALSGYSSTCAAHRGDEVRVCRFLRGRRADRPCGRLALKCEGRDTYHGSQVTCPGILHLVNREPAVPNPPFDARKFWLSSAAMFAGFLVIALLPSCTKAAEPQPPHQSHWTSAIEHS